MSNFHPPATPLIGKSTVHYKYFTHLQELDFSVLPIPFFSATSVPSPPHLPFCSEVLLIIPPTHTNFLLFLLFSSATSVPADQLPQYFIFHMYKLNK